MVCNVVKGIGKVINMGRQGSRVQDAQVGVGSEYRCQTLTGTCWVVL